jgi:hypothetical protein
MFLHDLKRLYFCTSDNLDSNKRAAMVDDDVGGWEMSLLAIVCR